MTHLSFADSQGHNNTMASEKTIISPEIDISTKALSAANLLGEMLLDYSKRDPAKPMDQWLTETLSRQSGIEMDQAQDTARDILSYIADSHALRGELQQHLSQGKSRSSWIASQVERIANETGAQPADVAELNALLLGKGAEAKEEGAKPQDWNEISRIAIARGLEQQSLQTAAASALEDGARQLARDAANSLLKEHPNAGKLAQDFIDGKLDVTSAASFQATLAAATEIAARKGLLGADMQQNLRDGHLIPGWFAHQTFVGTENARVLHALGSGALDPNTALDQMANTATAAATRAVKEVCKRVGGNIGATLAAMIPVAGLFLAPVGRKVGEFIGSWVGEVASGEVGTTIRKGFEAVKTVASKVISTIKDTAKGVFKTLTFGIFA